MRMMNNLVNLLRSHAARYPKMEPSDVVKLLYQHEFGGGHMVRDPESCLQFLRREFAATCRNPDALKYEDIGNGRIRVYLAALTEAEMEQLGLDFLRDSQLQKGTLESFLEKLEVLRQLAGEGVFAFDQQSLEEYLDAYAAAGYPMVSHSEAYRAAYHPAYRVIYSK